MKVTRAGDWFGAADDLQVAMDLLRPNVLRFTEQLEEWRAAKTADRNTLTALPANGCWAVFLMLAAYAIENLCKGALIRGHPPISAEDTDAGLKLAGDMKSHQLRRLVRAVNLPVSREEQGLLGRLTRAAVWRGRYPVPVDAEKVDTVRLDDGTVWSTAVVGKMDTERTDAFIERLRDHIGAPRNPLSYRDLSP